MDLDIVSEAQQEETHGSDDDSDFGPEQLAVSALDDLARSPPAWPPQTNTATSVTAKMARRVRFQSDAEACQAGATLTGLGADAHGLRAVAHGPRAVAHGLRAAADSPTIVAPGPQAAARGPRADADHPMAAAPGPQAAAHAPRVQCSLPEGEDARRIGQAQQQSDPPTKKRGRPKGAKNKPKPPGSVPATDSAPKPPKPQRRPYKKRKTGSAQDEAGLSNPAEHPGTESVPSLFPASSSQQQAAPVSETSVIQIAGLQPALHQQLQLSMLPLAAPIASGQGAPLSKQLQAKQLQQQLPGQSSELHAQQPPVEAVTAAAAAASDPTVEQHYLNEAMNGITALLEEEDISDDSS